MTYHVYIPSVEYQNFIVERLKGVSKLYKLNLPNSCPYQMVVEVRNDGLVHIDWNEANHTDNEQVDFSQIEQIVQNALCIKFDDEEVIFGDDGSIYFEPSHCQMSFDLLEKIYMKAKGNNEN